MNIEDANYPFENGLTVTDFTDLVNFDIVNVHRKIDEVSVFDYFVVGATVIKYFYAHCSLHDLLVFFLCATCLKSNS
jgi:hypothetical protein